MISYIARRFVYMLIMLAAMSLVAYVIIQLPPGDYVTMLISKLEATGMGADESQIVMLRRMYGLDLPPYLRYLKWVSNMLRGDFGRSMHWLRPVSELIGERLMLTVMLTVLTTAFSFIVAIPIGIYSATHQYSFADYTFMVVGFAGLATPNFLLSLMLMILFNNAFGISIGGLFSSEYSAAPWSFGKVIDMLKHLPVPIIIVGTSGTAGLIRVFRGMLLDELRRHYVITARAKGLAERTILFRYPVRVALNPVISTIGWLLPAIVSGNTIVALVLSLPTVGPLMYQALLVEDMFLAGTIVMFLSFLTIIGTFVSDFMLVVVDPRIRFERVGS